MWPNVEFRTQLLEQNLGLVRSSLQRTTHGWATKKGPRTDADLNFSSNKDKFASSLDADLNFSLNKNGFASSLDADLNFSSNKNGSASSLDADLNFS